MAVRVGLLQMNCSGAREENMVRAEQMIREAAGKDAQIAAASRSLSRALLHYRPQQLGISRPLSRSPARSLKRCRSSRVELGVVIVAPIYERVDRSVYYNSAAVIDADGELLGVYRKNHIPLNTIFYEKLYFKPGNLGYPVFNTRYGKIGILICHDRHYPEGARALALNGAEILLIPSATPDKSLSRKVWEKELCAHAIFNEYFVAGLNRTGKEGNYVYYGQSVAFDPAGEMLAQAGSNEEVLIIDCDLDLDHATTAGLAILPG